MSRKIYYTPFTNNTNQYCERMKQLLSTFGVVERLTLKSIFLNLFIPNKNIVIVNWIENDIISAKGDFSFFGFAKVFFILLILRIGFSKLIYVRHNKYPHGCNLDQVKKVKFYITLLENITSHIFTHSPAEANKGVYYVPHPLYLNSRATKPHNLNNKKFVIFGRIMRYKKIEHVIQNLPNNYKLIIAGTCDDKKYLSELNNLKNENVSILAKYHNDDEIRDIIANSEGVLITHNDEDMIVSGSFFYALSVNSKVITLQTDFFNWVKSNLDTSYITVINNITDLQGIESIIKTESKCLKPYQLFGDDIIIEHLKKLIFS